MANKAIPEYTLEFMTLQKKKAYRTIRKVAHKANRKEFEDCREILLLMQNCDDVEGYMQYVSLFYDMVFTASNSKSNIEEKHIREFNSVINELEDKICKNSLDVKKEMQQEYLSKIACIGDIYFGEVYDKEQSKYKYETMKNLNKAKKWYDIFIASSESEESLKYGRVMLNLAFIYKYGVGNLEANEDEMIKCLKEAANHGSSRACKYLAE